MNVEEYKEDLLKQLQIINAKTGFQLKLEIGAVLSMDIPDDNRINIDIAKVDGQINYVAEIGNKKYDRNELIFDLIEELINTNLNRFISIAMNQNKKVYDGSVAKLSIKSNSLFLNIDLLNVKEEDNAFINEIVEKVIEFIQKN